MFASRLFGLAISTAVIAAVVGVAPTARAQEECPLGSTQKSESGQTWCEPSVCDTDTQCANGSICRPVPLCVEIGALDQAPGTKSDAGQRLLARQRCGAAKACPQRTTCSEKSRCITRAQADKAGLLTTAAASGIAASGSAAAAAGNEPPKKGCGCHVAGAPGGEHLGALAMLGAVVIAAHRRTRRRSR
jgi:MYXO-CTERM domain-containing protein